jgi:hypothetical protein
VFVGVKPFIANADSLLAAAPFQVVCVMLKSERKHADLKELKELVLCPHLERLPELSLGRRMIGDSGVKALTTCKYLGNLRSLRLDYSSIGDRGAALLAKYPFKNLMCLDLAMNPIGRRGLRALAESSVFKPEMRIRAYDFDGTFAKFQEWERTRRVDGTGSGEELTR